MVDHRPGGLWWELWEETGATIAALLNKLFLERSLVEEIRMDNDTAFKSAQVKPKLDRWNVQTYDGAAYRPSGNNMLKISQGCKGKS